MIFVNRSSMKVALSVMSGVCICLMALLLGSMAMSGSVLAQSSVRPPVGATTSSTPSAPSAVTTRDLRERAAGLGAKRLQVPDPTAGKGARYDTNMWNALRKGAGGKVSIPDGKAGHLIQSEGWKWMKLRNGKLQRYGGWALGGTVLLLAVFFLFKGRIKIEGGWAGRTIARFSFIERMAHWLLAGSFVILALSGLNTLYGRALLLPLLGKPAFAELTEAGKLLHNYVAFAFMAGLILIFVMWVWHNIPTWRDIVWLLKLGGLLGHVPAGKFNAGQKILFWLIMLLGVGISATGLTMMFPFQVPLASDIIDTANRFGADLPATLSPVQEMLYANIWHAVLGLALTCIILAHIYIGTIGMQGAFAAMGSGEVDENWAREHHDIWAQKVLGAQALHGHDDAGPTAGVQPAE